MKSFNRLWRLLTNRIPVGLIADCATVGEVADALAAKAEETEVGAVPHSHF
jgi:hypothetical protein